AWTAEGDNAGARFGQCVASAGDVNGDGIGDVVIGAPLYNNYQGAAFLYLGSLAGLANVSAWTSLSSQSFANYGTSVATAGDVNGDGYGDVVVGADTWDAANGSLVNAGAAFVYLGTPTGLAATAAWMIESNEGASNYGHSVATAGDVN